MTIESLLSEHLVPLGFKRERKRWIRHGAEFSIALILERSCYGGQSFIDLHLTIGGSGIPDVATRLDQWADDERPLQEILVDDNSNIEAEFEKYVTERVTPLLQRLSVSYLKSSDGHLLLESALVSERAGALFDY